MKAIFLSSALLLSSTAFALPEQFGKLEQQLNKQQDDQKAYSLGNFYSSLISCSLGFKVYEQEDKYNTVNSAISLLKPEAERYKTTPAYRAGFGDALKRIAQNTTPNLCEQVYAAARVIVETASSQ